MAERISVNEYFQLPETMQPMELVYGVVREPPSPRYGHQAIVTTLTALLKAHVEREGLGIVCVSPIDVVMDGERALVIQPDVLFIASDRRHIIRDRIWGAPDLVVEVLSRRTMQRDRTTKLGWYREYGVKECWLVDPKERQIEIVYLDDASELRRTFSGEERIASQVLPDFELEVGKIF
jgi:Uma2 family endonuclease